MVTAQLDAAVWKGVIKQLSDPATLERERDAHAEHNPVDTEVAAIERALADIARRQANLVRVMAALDDADAAAPIVAELGSLAKQKRQLEADREALLARRTEWEAAQQQRANLQMWCEATAATLREDLTYEQRRFVPETLRVEVKVYRADHQPRWVATARLPYEAEPIILATAPCLVPHPRTCTRSGCW